MAFYHPIKYYPQDQQHWIAQHILDLRSCLNDQIRKKRSPGSLIIGSWNIRAFDGGVARENESFHYIAEVIDHFDICAVQEVKENLDPLKRLLNLLGPHWDYFVSDITTGSSGNFERMAFLYNTNKITFRNIIGEIVLDNKTLVAGNQIARTPFFAAFQAGWFKFTLCSSHITFGENDLRVKEIDAISKLLAKRAKKDGEVYVFLGDMNIDDPDNSTMQALKKNKMYVPLFGETNLAGGKHFDQITFTSENVKTDYLRHGVFDWRCAVFKPEDIDRYKKIAEDKRGKPYKKWNMTTYRTWTTQEMSDHFPIWVELKTDYSDKYLVEKFLK